MSRSETTPRSRTATLAGKDLRIESLRGLALLLMVAGHVIGRTAERGLQVPDDSWWRFAYVALADLRMPLFTFLSGYVYALRPPLARGGYAHLVRGKARRVLLPLVTVGALLFTMQLVVPGTNARPDPSSWWQVLVYGYEHLWFLQAIFLVFVLVGLLEVTGVLQTRRGWAVTFGVSVVVMWLLRLPPELNVFSLNETAYLLPFFLLGYAVARHRPAETRAGLAVLAVSFTVVMTAQLLVHLDVVAFPAWQVRATGLLVGMTGVLLLYALRGPLTARWLYVIGPFAFGVYLLHPFGTAATRIGLGLVGISATAVVFVVAMAVGVLGPVLVQKVTPRLGPVHTALFGERPPRRPRRTTPTSPQP